MAKNLLLKIVNGTKAGSLKIPTLVGGVAKYELHGQKHISHAASKSCERNASPYNQRTRDSKLISVNTSNFLTIHGRVYVAMHILDFIYPFPDAQFVTILHETQPQ